MVFKETRFKLKDGWEALLRSPCKKDAEQILRFIIRASGEEEFADFTLEQETSFIRKNYLNENELMIACFVNGKVAGNCQARMKGHHIDVSH